MSDQRLTPFTTLPPLKGDVALILRADGSADVFVQGMSPIQIMNSPDAAWMSAVMDCLALRGLRNETGLMQAARQQIIDQMKAAQ